MPVNIGVNSNADLVVSNMETLQSPEGFATIHIKLTVTQAIDLPVRAWGTMTVDDLATFLSLHGERSHLEKACILAEQNKDKP